MGRWEIKNETGTIQHEAFNSINYWESLRQKIIKLRSKLKESISASTETQKLYEEFKLKLNQARDVITVTQELNKELEKKVKKSEEETKKMVTNHSRWIQSELTKIQCPRCTMKIFGLFALIQLHT